MAKILSCGVLVVNEHGQLLLAHVTGQRQWDIPKGTGEPGETPPATALRELREETGVTLEPSRLHDLGVTPYMPTKDLHLFIAHVAPGEIDIARCKCTAFFQDRRGRQVPEMDAFRWAAGDEVPELCTRRMAEALAKVPPLAA